MNWTLAPGHTLDHYRIITPLGSGGMGEVFLAEDIRLHRNVALKVIAPRLAADDDRLRRFEQEARAVSSLNHPNVLTVFDVGAAEGVHYIATEYVDGVTLRSRLRSGAMAVNEAIDVAFQIAGALEAAHAAGVIHRDLKPENVMLRRDGYVKVLDFGLAKLGEPPGGSADEATRVLAETSPGTIVGTSGYMSPEQARGLAVDARSDLFSLGVVLYEMLTGSAPFTGETFADTIAAVVSREPAPIGAPYNVPPGLERIVFKALGKARDDRYPSAAELAADLRAVSLARLAGAAAPPASPPPAKRRRTSRAIESVAVLPLVNAAADPDLEFLADGLTESLINNLSPLPKLRVLARSAVFRYKDRTIDPLVLGRELGVRAVLTGRVQRRGEQFFVAAELVLTEDGTQLWGAQLARRQSDLFALQEEISREIADALRVRLTGAEKRQMTSRPAPRADAYELYLKGRYFVNKRTSDGLGQALALFERAITADPGYALAHAGLADCFALMATGRSSFAAVDAIAGAKAAAARALELDEGLADAHASLAFVKFRFEWEFAGAELEFRRALDLNPGHIQALHWYGMFLASRRRFDEALAHLHRAQSLDPLSLVVQSGIGRVLHFGGRYDDAVALYRRILEVDPQFAQSRVDLSLTLLVQGRIAELRAELNRAVERAGEIGVIMMLRGICDLRDGNDAGLRSVLEQMRTRYRAGTVSPDEVVCLAFYAGETDEALEYFEAACVSRAPILPYFEVEPMTRDVRSDPRFSEIARRHGLPLMD